MLKFNPDLYYWEELPLTLPIPKAEHVAIPIPNDFEFKAC